MPTHHTLTSRTFIHTCAFTHTITPHSLRVRVRGDDDGKERAIDRGREEERERERKRLRVRSDDDGAERRP